MRAIKEEQPGPTEYRDYAGAHRQFGRLLDAAYDRKRAHSALGCPAPAELEYRRWRADRSGRPAP
jgi:hypothetical protein